MGIIKDTTNKQQQKKTPPKNKYIRRRRKNTIYREYTTYFIGTLPMPSHIFFIHLKHHKFKYRRTIYLKKARTSGKMTHFRIIFHKIV